MIKNFRTFIFYNLLNIMKQDIIKILKNGGVGIMPTDTLYGLVGSAYSKKAVNRIYKLKKRKKSKKLIVLISYFVKFCRLIYFVDYFYCLHSFKWISFLFFSFFFCIILNLVIFACIKIYFYYFNFLIYIINWNVFF